MSCLLKKLRKNLHRLSIRGVAARLQGEGPMNGPDSHTLESTMAFDNLSFCWHGVITPDPEGAAAFYPEVVGWQVQTMPMGDEESTMFAAGGVPRLHLAAPTEDGIPAHFDNYLRVADVDAATEAAVAHGGARIVPPTDIPPGRFSVVASPSGALVHLFHEADEASSTNAPPADGGIHWVELHSHQLDDDLAWLKATFSMTTETMQMPTGPYTILRHGEDMVGGAMPAQQEGAPSMWLTWIRVDDLDAARARVTANGGQLHGDPMTAEGVGRMVVAADPSGAVFGLIQPAA